VDVGAKTSLAMVNTAPVPVWAVVVLTVVGWCALAVVVGLGLGAVIRRREQQRSKEK
jgi:Kef-type K+ transport system membrane component KefB